MDTTGDASAAATGAFLLFAKGFPPTPGGVETYSAEVAGALARAGREVLVVTNAPEPIQPPGPGVTTLNVRGGSQPAVLVSMLRTALALRRQGIVPRAIHATTWRVAIVPMLVWPKANVSVSVHGREILNGNVIIRRLMSTVLHRSRGVVCVSRATQQLLDTPRLRSVVSRSVVAWNGLSRPAVALGPVRGQNEGLRLFTVARLVPRKGVLEAIQAVGALDPQQRSRVTYRIAGRGPQLAEAKELVARLGLGEHVTLLGYVPDEALETEFDEADVFVHPHSNVGEGNDFEGFGIVIADAMAAGCVPVVGHVGGPTDFITHRGNGLLVDGQDVNSIASAISDLVEDRHLVARLSAEASSFARANFSWDAHADAILGCHALTRDGLGAPAAAREDDTGAAS